MKALLLSLLHWAVMTATLCGPGGVRAVIAEHLLLKQQLIVLRRPRQRAPRLTASDRLLFGFGALFLSPGRIRKVISSRLWPAHHPFPGPHTPCGVTERRRPSINRHRWCPVTVSSRGRSPHWKHLFSHGLLAERVRQAQRRVSTGRHRECCAVERVLGLIRSRGHVPKGGYDVPYAQEPGPASAPAVR